MREVGLAKSAGNNPSHGGQRAGRAGDQGASAASVAGGDRARPVREQRKPGVVLSGKPPKKMVKVNVAMR